LSGSSTLDDYLTFRDPVCRLSGLDRKWPAHGKIDAVDPHRKSARSGVRAQQNRSFGSQNRVAMAPAITFALKYQPAKNQHGCEHGE